MTDRSNRTVLTALGLVLLAGGGLSAALGAAAFGTDRSNRDVFDATVIRWWNEGGWESFAVVVVIGAVAVLLGGRLALGQLRRNDGRHRTPTVTFPANGSRGQTTLRSPALSHNLEADLETIPEVTRAAVGLFGRYPTIEVRAVLTVGDDIDLADLPAKVGQALGRVETTTGIRPDPVQITLRFRSLDHEHQLA